MPVANRERKVTERHCGTNINQLSGRIHRPPSRHGLKKEVYWVRGVDIKLPEFAGSDAGDFQFLDL